MCACSVALNEHSAGLVDKHALSRLFDPQRVWVVHALAGAELQQVKAAMADWIADGRARLDELSPGLLAAEAAPIAAEVVWLLMDADQAAALMPRLARISHTK